MNHSNLIKIGLAQISPVWLNKKLTINKVKSYLAQAGSEKCDIVIFGEGIIPGYPFWVSLTNGAVFNSTVQKEIFAHYLRNSIQIESGDLDDICKLANDNNMAIYLGIIERAENRGGHSLYCSLVYIDKKGQIKSVHRKLQPTYEERLVWSQGDGNGLQVHQLNDFKIGGLNCWENWMPLVRSSLYGLGENLHIAVWPGAKIITQDITRFISKESRSFVVSVSGLMTINDFPKNTPHIEKIIKNCPEVLADGGSCIAGPDGEWIVKPSVGKEELIVETIDINRVYEERQNFDPVGHYSRPDVTKLSVNRDRQTTLDLN